MFLATLYLSAVSGVLPRIVLEEKIAEAIGELDSMDSAANVEALQKLDKKFDSLNTERAAMDDYPKMANLVERLDNLTAAWVDVKDLGETIKDMDALTDVDAAFDSMETEYQIHGLSSGPCTNVHDESALRKLVPMIKECTAQTKIAKAEGHKNFFPVCMSFTAGMTMNCATCTGKLFDCRNDFCKAKCGEDISASLWKNECFDCNWTCIQKMTQCGGIDTIPYPTCIKTLTGEMAWVCDVFAGYYTAQQAWERRCMYKPENCM